MLIESYMRSVWEEWTADTGTPPAPTEPPPDEAERNDDAELSKIINKLSKLGYFQQSWDRLILLFHEILFQPNGFVLEWWLPLLAKDTGGGVSHCFIRNMHFTGRVWNCKRLHAAHSHISSHTLRHTHTQAETQKHRNIPTRKTNKIDSPIKGISIVLHFEQLICWSKELCEDLF